MNDDLVERVARAMFDARHSNLRDCWSWDDYWGDDQEPDRKFYYRDARVAIAIALEEAAKVAAGNERSATEYYRGRVHAAAAIRAMITD
jgi:hypothetical protein